MAGQKISVVINTVNEEKDIERALRSVQWADEILVCDMHSTDKTVEIVKSLGTRVILHPFVNYVEPARNFAVSKASGDWVLILDPDEEIPESLAKSLRGIADKQAASDFVEIPRKNIIFGKWMKGSGWWPDYNIRFFKKGSVKWSDKIHRSPHTSGQGLKLPQEDGLAIIHHHYSSISQFLERMNRYTNVQAEELYKEGYKFNWKDLISKPLSEFLGRFFVRRGYEDGVHGLSLSLLQAFSFLVTYLKVWETEKFSQEDIKLGELKEVSKKAGGEIDYWFSKSGLVKNILTSLFQKTRRKW